MLDFQALIDAMNHNAMTERSRYAMTLGRFIKALEALPPDAPIQGFGELDSFRGYYSDLAFEPSEERQTVAALLARCKKAIGETFEGYKGGEYVMTESTPLWMAPYGSSTNDRLAGIEAGKDGVYRPVVTVVTE